MIKQSRPTIGFLVSGITDSFTEFMCKGVMRAAKAADVNLVILPGKYINRNLENTPEIAYEYQNNTMFSYATKDSFDGLVIAADCIGVLTTKANTIRFLADYKDIPVVLLASKVSGYVSVNFDNEQGIRDGLSYIIESQGCRKIGMIGGPDDNTDAIERKAVYLSVLKEHNVPFEERYFVEGNFCREGNPAAAQMLAQNPDIEAVFCVNDDSALALYHEMELKGLVPGKDIKIFGYDDTVYAAKAKPSLSSVCADPAELGVRAVEMLLARLDGKQLNSEVLKTRLIKRNSLRTVELGSAKDMERLLSTRYIDEYFDSIFYRFQQAEDGADIARLRIDFRRMMEKVCALVSGGEDSQELHDEIFSDFDAFLNNRALQYADVDNLLSYFSRIFHAMKHTDADLNSRYSYGQMFSVLYRKIIEAMDWRFSEIEDEVWRSRQSMKNFVRDMLQFDRGNDKSYAVLLQNLDWLGIHNGFIYTFEEPLIHLYKEQFHLPDKMLVKATLVDGVVQSVPQLEQEIAVSDLFTPEHMGDTRYAMVALPLFYNEMLYGIVLCDMTDALYENGEFLADHLSSATKMIVMLKANEDIQQQLEESLSALKENNIKLDNLSKSDALTGIRNRRGFLDEAKNMLASNRTGGKSTLVSYIDMNNLKIINDRYGHEEGDFSLKLIGELLVATAGENGIVGRIGGDEFSLVMEYDKERDVDEIVPEIARRFTEFNFVSDKPYNVTVSTGAYLVAADSTETLEEAMAHADEKLYVAKQSRLKTVAKKEIR